MPTQTCGARTSRKNAGRGRPCKMTRVGANGRCKFHGGHSTGPRTKEGRNRIARAQRERWRLWHAKNPRLFPDVKPRQERNIKRAYRQRQAKRNSNSWIERELGENWQDIMEEQRQEFERECAKARERNKPLTPEQYAEADKFLEHWAKVTKQRRQARDDVMWMAWLHRSRSGAEHNRAIRTRGSGVRLYNSSTSKNWSETGGAPGRYHFAETGSADQTPAISSHQASRIHGEAGSHTGSRRGTDRTPRHPSRPSYSQSGSCAQETALTFNVRIVLPTKTPWKPSPSLPLRRSHLT